MRIAFLVFNLDGPGGTARSVVTQANALVALTERGEGSHEVSVVSVHRSADRPHYELDPAVAVTYVVDDRGGHPQPVRSTLSTSLSASVVDNLVTLPSRLVLPQWDRYFHRLHDVVLRDALADLDVDVLVTTTPELVAMAAQLAPPGIALVHQEHRSTSQRVADLPALLTFAPQLDVLVSLSEYSQLWLQRELGEVAPPMAVMPNALPAGFHPRSRLDRPLILAAGRIEAEKRYAHLVMAFAEVAHLLPGWRVRILGAGLRRGELFALARKYGLGDRVELPGNVTDMPSEWAKGSMTVLSSKGEGFPLVLQESMAAGVPPISYDCASGPREIITTEHDGLLVQDGSIAGLAAAILRLARDEDLRRRLGDNAVETARQWDTLGIARQWVSIYERAAETRRERGGVERPVAPVRGIDEAPAEVVMPTHLTPRDVRREALDWVVRGARAAVPDWFVIPSYLEHAPVVVVPESSRLPLLQALAADAPDWLSIAQPAERRWHDQRHPVPEGLRDLARGKSGVMIVEPWPEVEGAPRIFRTGCRVQVQFWDDDLTGQWIAPVRNRYFDRFDPTWQRTVTRVHDVEVPTLPEMTLPAVEECQFDVDVVVTWVDGDDPAWNERRLRALGMSAAEAHRRESSGRARYQSRDELRFALRSIHLFAPWVRRIHLVTAGQTPTWLDVDHPSISMVDHADIFPASALPSFSSHAIETRLHHIPDLSEHFVYVNDDVMLMKPVGRETFFTPGGQFYAFRSPTVVGFNDDDAVPYLKAAENNRRMLREAFGVFTTHTMAHTPHPHRRSVLAEIESRFPAEIAATTHAPFRAATDVSLLSSFAQHYGVLTGSALMTTPQNAYVNLGSPNLEWLLRTTSEKDVDFLCIADHHEFAMRTAAVDAALESFFATCFPVPAPWEKDLQA